MLDLPGVDPRSIELTVDRNRLTVRDRRQAAFGEDEQVLVAERPHGSFIRQLVLGLDLNTDPVWAHYTNGLLHLTIPVKQSSQPRDSRSHRAARRPVSSGRSST